MARPFGILLAGGRGERMGRGIPKAMVVLEGDTLLARAAATLAAVCDELVVAAPPEIELPLPTGAHRILDPGEGPLGGLAVAAALVPSEIAIALGVDFPLVRPETLAALADGIGEALAVVPAPEGRPQPLVAAYAAKGLAALAASFERGERSVVRALESLHPRWLDDRAIASLPGGAESFFDVDTPADLAEAGRRIGAGRP